MSFLFVDRIVASRPGTFIKGVKHITRNDAYLTTDEQGKPCFTSSLIGETLGQLAAWNVMQHNGFTLRPVAGIVASAQLFRPAYLGETLLLESYIDSLDEGVVQYHSIARVKDETVFKIDGALGPLLPMRDFIDASVVKQQYAEIYQEGDWAAVSALCAVSSDDTLEEKTRLPTEPMQFDAILASEPSISLTAKKFVSPVASYFPDHFPNKPVLPMTVLLECKINLAREFLLRAGLSEQYQFCELRKIKMNGFVCPGDMIFCYVTMKQHTDEGVILSFRSEVLGKRVCVADAVLVPKRGS
jgi:3-hydroxymyristoyl/3-hydroxydecanoyl-(acyl carrier protein) dehydratase